jgi:hypothetical protein
MIASGFAFTFTNDEQNEGNEQTLTCGCRGQPSVGDCSFDSFCSSLVKQKTAGREFLDRRRAATTGAPPGSRDPHGRPGDVGLESTPGINQASGRDKAEVRSDRNAHHPHAKKAQGFPPV